MTLGEGHWVNRLKLGELCTMFIGFIKRVTALVMHPIAQLAAFLLLIPQVRPAHKYPISPWEMIHLPVGGNALCMQPYKVYMDVCNKSLTATYQYKISSPSNKVLVNNN
jgi:hypothetical protein